VHKGSRWGVRSAVCAVVLTLVAVPVALGAPPKKVTQLQSDGGFVQGPFAEQVPEPANLPAKQENTEVVGTYRVPGVKPGQIADVAVHKGYAYLNSWDDPDCEGGGTHVVDIRNPSAPQRVGFIPAPAGYYHGEGAHVVSIDVPGFKGDILAVNDEAYGANVDLNSPCGPDTTTGGFDLYDVTDPAHPVELVQLVGDRDPDGDPDTPPRALPDSYHSVFVWQDGPRAFLVASDNVDLADVDIFDITNPRAPVQVGDHDLVALFPEILDNEEGNGGAVFHHDVVVKHIGGKPIMKADYWDAGYVQLDVSDPANPTLVNDTTFAGEDPHLPGSNLTREGNAHQGEFSHDNQFLLTADEDFGAFRYVVNATSGPTNGRQATGAEGDAEATIAELPDGRMNGPSEFVGDACDPAAVPAAPADDGDPDTEDIALVERGGEAPGPDPFCGFAQKFDNTQAAGWDALIVFNQPRPDDGQVNMATGEGGIPGVQMRRVDAIGSRGVLTNAADDPPPGTAGPDIVVEGEFDGWGYAHLYDANTTEEIDTFAIDEAKDPRFAEGFGDLSIHEFATDPATNLAYSAYYAGGIRVFRFSREAGLEQMGAYIAPGGSNFWGVEQFTAANGERLIAGSDRDFGLVILRYTGPGAVGPTQSQPQPPATPPAGPSAGRCTNIRTVSAGVAFVGDEFGEQITGTPRRDRINAAAGDDCVDGLAGHDRLRGGRGVDTIDGQRGNDRIRGNAGRGNLRGGRGNDRIWGAAARDTLFGNTGRDRLKGGANRDSLFGGGGKDRLTGGKGRDVIEAGTGDDRIYAKDGKVDRIDCGFGDDTVVTRDRKDRMTSCENR
jgi:hypothetical protein